MFGQYLSRHFDLDNLKFKVKIFSDLPIASGFGSSSSIIIALIKIFSKLSGKEMSVEDTFKLCQDIETFSCR